MLNFKTSTTAILILAGLTISSVAGVIPGSNSILPNLEKTSPIIQIVKHGSSVEQGSADQGSAIDAKEAKSKLKAALKKLRGNEDFLAALQKNDIKSVTKMVVAESGVKAPLTITISGNGTVVSEHYKVRIYCTWPPVKCGIEIIF